MDVLCFGGGQGRRFVTRTEPCAAMLLLPSGESAEGSRKEAKRTPRLDRLRQLLSCRFARAMRQTLLVWPHPGCCGDFHIEGFVANVFRCMHVAELFPSCRESSCVVHAIKG